MQTADRCFVRLEARLHQLARGILRGRSRGQLLQTTALVNEAYLRIRKSRPTSFKNDAQFVHYAALTMRSILVDAARSRARRDSKLPRVQVPLESLACRFEKQVGPLIDLDEALRRMESQAPDLYEVAMFKLFSGLDMVAISELLEVRIRTAEHHWTLARKWLSRTLR